MEFKIRIIPEDDWFRASEDIIGVSATGIDVAEAARNLFAIMISSASGIIHGLKRDTTDAQLSFARELKELAKTHEKLTK